MDIDNRDWYYDSPYRNRSAIMLQDTYQYRRMSRNEYKFWQRVERTNDCFCRVPLLDNWLEIDDTFTHHLFMIGEYVKQSHWPDDLQYHAVSEGYSIYLAECLGDIAGDMYIKEIEEASSRYFGEY